MTVTKESSLQAKMAVASFVVGSIIACVCIFLIEPKGEINTTAISIVSEFLVLTGALLGVDASYSNRMKKIEERLADNLGKKD